MNNSNAASIVSIRVLENEPNIENVQVHQRAPVSVKEIDAWEWKNAPFKLPQDMKTFFYTSDGFSLTWDMRDGDIVSPMGNMNINRLEQVQRIESLPIPTVSCPPRTTPAGASASMSPKDVATRSDELGVFVLDRAMSSGTVALLYMHGPEQEPQVWFQDLNMSWNFVARTFSDFFRLVLMNMGLPNWLYTFTGFNADPVTQIWLKRLCPHIVASAARPGSGAKRPPSGLRMKKR
ncbi:hypothetical protein J8273_3310 [Carpediemonas membranifera]|uniref:Knr4/Smi1-like domain-containing protein n=1 Tax=Carpediemonas membranifera TaxID=201153 RepID=A0A8J6AWA5_9EUKA|nr:hypothetical protein J8273_3310 [Carpediemonas membranifera]|eukprot:KAG9393180.1 hypothetical protein J8273_3310 [Carpediemonas membranifera]